MIFTHLVYYNILNAKDQYIVIPVNCVGTMDKGIARQYKQRYPQGFQAYKQACDEGLLKPGKLFYMDKFIFFPTQNHWRMPAELQWIEAGLRSLKRFMIRTHATSVAIPKLGCGCGHLDEWDVSKLIFETFGCPVDFDLTLYWYQDQHNTY